MSELRQVVISLTALAARGVDYSPRWGALCPQCQRRAKVYATRPWEGRTRVRYHHCQNNRCVLAALGATIKSIEEDKEENQ